MASKPVDPRIQELMDLIEPPDDGHQARGTSDFGTRRETGSDPHVGFDMNRGRGVQPHGRVTSPVHGMIKEIQRRAPSFSTIRLLGTPKRK